MLVKPVSIGKGLHANDSKMVSVIIPTLNSSAFLDVCLSSLQRQSYKNLEIIIIDQGSWDHTLMIARKYADKIIECERPKYYASPSQNRNYGSMLSKGSYLLHADSDMELDPLVVEKCVTLCKSGFDAVVIPEFDVGSGFWADCKKIQRLSILGDSHIEAARFFKREAFFAVNGYAEPAVAAEDWWIHRKLLKAGFKIGRINSPIFHHTGRMSLPKQILKKYYYGRNMRKFLLTYPDFLYKAILPMKKDHFSTLEASPHCARHVIGIIFLRACELIGGFIGVLVGE